MEAGRSSIKDSIRTSKTPYIRNIMTFSKGFRCLLNPYKDLQLTEGLYIYVERNKLFSSEILGINQIM
ncbi:hypothetical protein AUJ87_02990 [Candidatus Gracilibacteria bacterium CG1_02_38_174]|nr:MAG: hypothetical protein AUJ87_02990 [Candidatus Gracilibacteria bacterium CG1_02_38_174]